jgi:hypothetical protein
MNVCAGRSGLDRPGRIEVVWSRRPMQSGWQHGLVHSGDLFIVVGQH